MIKRTKKNYFKKKIGVTLVEALMVVSIGTISMSTIISMMSESKENEEVMLLSNQMSQILEGIDRRIAIDRFDISHWPAIKDYNTTSQVSEFLNKELIAFEAINCGQADGWKPQIEDAAEDLYRNKLKLVPCGIWKNKIMFNLEAELHIQNTGSFLTKVYTILSFKDEDDFLNGFLLAKRSMVKARLKSVNKETGTHNYKFVDKSAPYPELTELSTRDCMDKAIDCGIYLGFESSGEGFEQLHVDGSNSMVNSKVTFKKDNTASKISDCHSFSYDVSTGWTPKANVSCGIGIDPDYGIPFVEANLDSVNTERLYLNKNCELSTGKVQPCGIYKDPDSSNSVLLASDEVDSELAEIKILNVNDGRIDDLTVQTKLKANEAYLNTLDVNGKTILKGDATFEGENNIFEKDLTVLGHTTLGELTVNLESTFKEDVKMEQNLTVLGTLEADSYKLGAITTLGGDCTESERNSLKLFLGTRDTELAICADLGTGFKWKLANARKGQIIAFNGECPEGFTPFEDGEGRFLVGVSNSVITNNGSTDVNPDGSNVSYSLGDTGGTSFVKLKMENLPSHSHDIPTISTNCSSGTCQGYANLKSGTDTYWSSTRQLQTGATGGDIPAENRPSYYAVNYCTFEGI